LAFFRQPPANRKAWKTEKGLVYVDYKEVEDLKRFLRANGKLGPRKTTRLTAGEQRKVALAVKRARFMALLPFVGRPSDF
jgi:small subunit ribosomal protein S18